MGNSRVVYTLRRAEVFSSLRGCRSGLPPLPRRLTWLCMTAQHAAWERPRMRALRVYLGPRNKRGDDPLRLRDQAPALTREILHILWRLGRHGLGIEQHQISHVAFGQRAAVGNTKQGGWDRRQFVHRLFEAQHLPVAAPRYPTVPSHSPHRTRHRHGPHRLRAQ